MTDPVLLSKLDERSVLTLTMNRPDVKNAFNTALIHAITTAFSDQTLLRNARAVILTGTGTAFSAGADLNMMKHIGEASVDENKQDAEQLAAMLKTVYDCSRPVIARVNGPAFGGGVGLVAACDIAIASDHAIFALSEARLGLVPATISPFVLEAMGPRQARRFFMTAERFDASAAKELNLVHEVAPANSLDNCIERVIGDLLHSGPEATRECKTLIESVKDRSIDSQLMQETSATIARLRASDEGREGIDAFLSKRKPTWVTE